MSGPVTQEDAIPLGAGVSQPAPAAFELTTSRETQVGAIQVRRALPQRGRRTVGAWCFVDHMGPAPVSGERSLDIAAHPHIGLQTVTWLLAGEVVHRDSLGFEQVIRPGQLNLMTAGRGVSHSEESTGHNRGDLHGVQLWVAQPAATRNGEAAFEHHPELPRLDLGGGSEATVIVGDMAGASSPARRDSDHVGVDLDLGAGSTTAPLQVRYEYALVVLTGAVLVDAHEVKPGRLAYLGAGRDELRMQTKVPSRALLFGGMPRDEPLVMWWNFVADSQQEISDAYIDWRDHGDRFGSVASRLPRIEVGPPPWTRLKNGVKGWNR
jgi:redox-sensitive bicupin YhaK (pirin superfamily)